MCLYAMLMGEHYNSDISGFFYRIGGLIWLSSSYAKCYNWIACQKWNRIISKTYLNETIKIMQWHI